MKKYILPLIAFLITISSIAQQGDPKITEVWTPVPKVVTPGKTAADAPSDATVLYNAVKDSANWVHINGKAFNWSQETNGFTVKPTTGDIQTKKTFGDCQLHIEWRTPANVKGTGQGTGNSGIFFMGIYELQVLDNYNNTTYSNGQAGSIYKQRMPLVNVCRPPGEWQSYDVIFTAPVFNTDSTLKTAARITVIQNGVLVQNNVEIWGSTQYIGVAKYIKHAPKLPIKLQDHGDLVSYRNIWLREL